MSLNLSKVLSRRLMANQSAMLASRGNKTFNYPHTFGGVNSSLTDIPQKDVYPDLPRKHQEGDLPHFAHQNVREFPEWYKPYGFNYFGHGWLAFILFSFSVCSYSYFNDIKMEKGRKKRKIYYLHNENTKSLSDFYKYDYIADRIKAGDPHYTKFLEKKERAQPHH